MITYKKGNLLDATENIIAHGCNNQGVMGAGVAMAIKNKWPKVYDDYRKEYESHGLSLGRIVWVDMYGKLFANAITQSSFGRDGRYVDYDAISDCMDEINRVAMDNNFSVAMPMIGAGLGGGDWKIIEKIINDIMTVPVTIYQI